MAFYWEGIIVSLDLRFVVYLGAAGVDESAGVVCPGAGVGEGARVDKGAGVDEGAGVVCPGSCDVLMAGVEEGAGVNLLYTITLFYQGGRGR